MKKFKGVVITVSDDPASFGDLGDMTLEDVIDKWEDFLVDELGVSIDNTGGDSMYNSYRIEESPDDFDEDEFREAHAEAWEKFCSR